MALKAGVKKGGAAKGELVLAIFELANCFRHGWGIAKDPVAAKQVSARPPSLNLGVAIPSQSAGGKTLRQEMVSNGEISNG